MLFNHPVPPSPSYSPNSIWLEITTSTVCTVTSQQIFVGLGDILKTSSARLQRNNFTSSKTSWRRLEDMSWRRLEDMSWRRLEDMFWRRLEDMSSRRLEDIMETKKIQNTYWRYLYLTNLNVYLTNLHLTILRRIQNALNRTHHFNICLILELKQHLYFKN